MAEAKRVGAMPVLWVAVGLTLYVLSSGPVCPLMMHKGGVHFGFADGAVKFISDSIDPQTYANLATIDDGHEVSGF